MRFCSSDRNYLKSATSPASLSPRKTYHNGILSMAKHYNARSWLVQSSLFLRFFEFTRHTHGPGRPATAYVQGACSHSVSSSSGSIFLRSGRIRNEAYLETRPSGLKAHSIEQTQFNLFFFSFFIEGSPAARAMRTGWLVLLRTSRLSSRLGRWRWFLVETFRRREPMPPGAMEAHLVAVASDVNISLIIDKLVNEGLDVQLVSWENWRTLLCRIQLAWSTILQVCTVDDWLYKFKVPHDTPLLRGHCLGSFQNAQVRICSCIQVLGHLQIPRTY